MGKPRPSLFARFERAFTRPEHDPVDRRRRVYVGMVAIIMAPLLGLTGLVDLVHERTAEGWRTIGIGLLFAVAAARLRYRSSAQVQGFFRLILGLGCLVVVREMWIGESSGLSFLWLYSLPLTAFYLFGRREALAWVVGLGLPVTWVLLEAEGDRHPVALMAWRFAFTFGAMAVIAYALERSRLRYLRLLSEEKRAVEESLAHVEMLRGLLPMCSLCKRVRDDGGYWNRIESYIETYSAAEVAPDWCPDCSPGPGNDRDRAKPGRHGNVRTRDGRAGDGRAGDVGAEGGGPGSEGRAPRRLDRFAAWLVDPSLPREELRKRFFLFVAFVPLTLVALGYFYQHWRLGETAEATLALLLAVIFCVTLFLLRRPGVIAANLRWLAVLFTPTALYSLEIGVADGGLLLWLYLHPVLSLNLFGLREGLFWSTVVSIGGLCLMLHPSGFPYSLGLGLRFFVTFLVVLAVAYGLESSRQAHYGQLLREKAALDQVLGQIRTLRGLLPICPSCKRVREGDGWEMLEAYLVRHSEAVFSHGLCPSCFETHYPDFLTP